MGYGIGMHKAEKGLIKVEVNVENGVITNVIISGDFFLYPEDSLWILEKKLIGVKARKDSINRVLENFFKEYVEEAPYVSKNDFLIAFEKALEKAMKNA